MKKRPRGIADRETAMGDAYKVYRNAKGMWCSVVSYKDGRGTRVCCTGSPFVWVARDVYFDRVQAAQKDALDGKNSYINAEFAHAYKMR